MGSTEGYLRAMARAGRVAAAATVLTVMALVATGCTSDMTTGGARVSDAAAADAASEESGVPAAAVPADRIAEIERITAEAMGEFGLRALLVQVNVGGRTVVSTALGESMTGVPATTDMHFRNGAMAFTYIGQAVLQLVDEGRMSLDDPLATWFPELPAADEVTVRDLLSMTSGYADYVYEPAVTLGTQADPFRQWTDAQMIEIGVSKPLWFEPGTNWAYSHTNYVILGTVLQAVTGQPLNRVLQEYVLDPMGLDHTGDNAGTPAIPEPALHTFTSERREFLQIPAEVPFTEESTYWNPSWTTANGAVQTTTIDDMTRSMEIVGSGAQLPPDLYEQQVGPALVGFGSPDPTGGCPRCATLTQQRHYGLGVVLRGEWITQTKSFAGSAGTAAYLPEDEIAISVVCTYLPSAFDDEAQYGTETTILVDRIATVLAPGRTPGV